MNKFPKRLLALVLSALLVFFCFAALADGAEGEPVIPKNASEFGDDAFVDASALVSMKTLRTGSVINVTLSGPVDSLQVNWMGYQEVPEELTVSDDYTAQVYTGGHKYQPGAKWTNKYTEMEYLIHLIDGSDYFNVINEDKLAAAKKEIEENIKHYDLSKDEEAQEWLKANGLKDPAVRSKLEAIIVDVVYYDEENDFWNYEIPSAYNADAYFTKEEYDADPSVLNELFAAYQKANPDKQSALSDWSAFWAYLVGRKYAGSDGSPNYAYTAVQGDYEVVYGRSGVIRYIVKNLKDADLFGVGAGDARLTYTKNSKGEWVATLVEFVSDFGMITAAYNANSGSLVDAQVVAK